MTEQSAASRGGPSALVSGLGELADVVHAIDRSCLVAVIDREQRLVYANGQLLELSEYASQEELDEAGPLWATPNDGPRLGAGLLTTVQQGQVWSGSLEQRTKGGRPYRLRTTIVPQVGSDGLPLRYLVVCREDAADVADEDVLTEAVQDLAELTASARARAARLSKRNRNLEARSRDIAARHAERVHTEKLSALGLMASAVAHEINNPLGGVMACVNALEEGSVPTERVPEYFATVRDALSRIKETVSSLLLYAHPGGDPVGTVDLREVVDGCRRLLSPLANRHRVTLTPSLPAKPASVPGDRSALSQALMNIMVNAIQASPRGGVIRITTEASDGGFSLSVHDQGGGIAPELLAKVTEPFFTTKPPGEGTGLGLHLAARILSDHDGSLAFDSRPGDTTVRMWLPAEAEAPKVPRK